MRDNKMMKSLLAIAQLFSEIIFPLFFSGFNSSISMVTSVGAHFHDKSITFRKQKK